MDLTIDAQRILQELACIGFAKVTDYLQIKDGQLLIQDTQQLPEDAARAVAAVERGTGGIKLKFYDKLKALELLGKYLSLFDQEGPKNNDPGLLERLLEAASQEVQTHEIQELL